MEGIVSGYDSPDITVYIVSHVTSGSGAGAQDAYCRLYSRDGFRHPGVLKIFTSV